VGYIGFWQKDQIPLSMLGNNDRFYLNYEVDRYQEIIETLRYEKPVYLYLGWDSTSKLIIYGYIGSDIEPIGEQEGQGVPPT
jgi:hypothetical protein